MSGLTATACFKVAQLEDNCSRNHSFLGSAVNISQKPRQKPSTHLQQSKVTKNNKKSLKITNLLFKVEISTFLYKE
jgi:hypothetical protein